MRRALFALVLWRSYYYIICIKDQFFCVYNSYHHKINVFENKRPFIYYRKFERFFFNSKLVLKPYDHIQLIDNYATLNKLN